MERISDISSDFTTEHIITIIIIITDIAINGANDCSKMEYYSIENLLNDYYFKCFLSTRSYHQGDPFHYFY